METFWFVVLVFMLAMYVVLDGFDFGVGMLYLLVARADVERRTVLLAIGPVWNGNEVWLIASGGILFFAFPRAYAAGFSGFYLALIMVLWLFMLRGLALELRMHFNHPLWTTLWDVGFAAASGLLAFVFGAALGNLIRGVPLNADGYFFTALWTDFAPGPEPGILDWFTLLVAVTTTSLLALHGALYLVLKTSGEVARRAGKVAAVVRWLVAVFLLSSAAAIGFVQPAMTESLAAHPLGWLFPLLALGGFGLSAVAAGRGAEKAAFAGSSTMILGLLATVAWGLFPNLLIASNDPMRSLTIHNAAASPQGLSIGLSWFMIGFPLVVVYSIVLHRFFWGKVQPLPEAGDHRPVVVDEGR